jgi:3-oxoacyl-[acyl-carrier protein] reductase
MDLGIAGRKAIVCASSRGLGRACALALAQAGCEVVINGRDGKRLEAVAQELHQATGARIVLATRAEAMDASRLLELRLLRDS